LARDAALLTAGQHARSRRLRSADRRRDFVAAHGLLRRTLSRVRPLEPAEWRFEVGPTGKPAVVAAQRGDPPIAFNLSHTCGLVACIVSAGSSVGIDVERTDRDIDSDAIASRFFDPAEAAHLRTLADGARRCRFVELWTLKEAYVKAVGSGLSMPLRDCVFELEGAHAVRLSGAAASAAPQWQFALYGICGDRYRLAIACHGSVAAMRPLETVVEAGSESTPVQLLRTSRIGE
jgi:4'-phosphopantetheinyl transferase